MSVIVWLLDLQLPMLSVTITTDVRISIRGRGVQHYVIEFVTYMRRISGFLRVFRFPPPRKTDRHDIAEVLLIVALNTIKQKNKLIRITLLCGQDI